MNERHSATSHRHKLRLMLLCFALLPNKPGAVFYLLPTRAWELGLLYVTNRGAVIEKPDPIYTILPSERLRMGVAHVRIGDENLDWETLHRLSTSDDPDDRPIVRLDWLQPMVSLAPKDLVADSGDAKAFFALVDKAQAAQLRHFTGRRMVVLAFLWPSGGSILRYFTDVANAAASVDSFVRLIELLAEHTQAAHIDVLAYSAGAQITSPGLAQLGMPRPGETREQLRQRLRLAEVYFAAPDIDTRRFVDDLGGYLDLVNRVTIAANLNDSALRVASIVHRASRAGRPDPTELDAEQTAFMVEASNQLGFDLIKVNPDDIPQLPKTSHAFWYEDPWVSGDLLGLMLLKAAPPQRGLEAQIGPRASRYWTFPPDFDERVKRLFLPATPTKPGPQR